MDYQMNASVSDVQTEDPVLVKRKVRGSYGKACTAMLIQLAVILIVSGVAGAVTSSILSANIMRENAGLDRAELMKKIMEASQEMTTNQLYVMGVNAIAYLAANLGAFFLMLGALKAFKVSDVFSKPRKVSVLGLGLFGILGVQGFSGLFQSLIEWITGMTGVSEQMQQNMSFGDSTAVNAVIFIYMVIIAPVTEEILCRGFVLNALAPVDRRFALVASSLIFGLMHGNLNQIFNGFLLGLVLGYIALKTGSVLPSICAHMLCNFNAVMCGSISEKLFGENADTAVLIWFAFLFVAGIASLIVFVRKNGRIDNTSDKVVPYEIAVPEGGKGEFTWKALLTRPTFWIFTVIYMAMAISSITAA